MSRDGQGSGYAVSSKCLGGGRRGEDESGWGRGGREWRGRAVAARRRRLVNQSELDNGLTTPQRSHITGGSVNENRRLTEIWWSRTDGHDLICRARVFACVCVKRKCI